MAFGDFTVTRASTKNILGSAGLYVSVANNVPAFEFNTDGTYRGLLVEPGATNLALQSQTFNEAVWAKTDITVTANSIVSPDGATTADTITEGTAGSAILNQAITVTAGATTTFSIFLKVGSVNDFVRIIINDNADLGNRVETWFRFSTGVLSGTGNQGTATGASASVQALPNGWYRVSLTGAIPAVTSYRMAVNSASASGSATRVNNSVYYAWQAQLETGSVATSPIVTTAGTASRVADVVTLTSASSLIGQAEGTMYTEFETRNPSSAGFFYSLSDGTGTPIENRLAIIQESNNTFTANSRVLNTNQCAIVTTNSLTGIQKMAFAYKVNDFAFYRLGVQIGTDTLGTVPTCNQIQLGGIQGSTLYFNGWIRSVALFPTRLANATLASLTA